MPAKFVKKPVVIEAKQVPEQRDEHGELDILLWIGKYVPIVAPSESYGERTPLPEEGVSVCSDDKCLEIFTLEGVMKARPGDWVIRGVNGEFYPCKNDIFWKTYDRYNED